MNGWDLGPEFIQQRSWSMLPPGVVFNRFDSQRVFIYLTGDYDDLLLDPYFAMKNVFLA